MSSQSLPTCNYHQADETCSSTGSLFFITRTRMPTFCAGGAWSKLRLSFCCIRLSPFDRFWSTILLVSYFLYLGLLFRKGAITTLFLPGPVRLHSFTTGWAGRCWVLLCLSLFVSFLSSFFGTGWRGVWPMPGSLKIASLCQRPVVL